jgi:hypothetical protein
MPLPSSIFNIAWRSILLFCFGLGYGLLVTHLHNDQRLAPFQVEGIIKPSYNWKYLVFWGVAGVGLGSLLPWVDTVWEDATPASGFVGTSKKGLESSPADNEAAASLVSGLAADWNPVVRSIGAFVGIAFAIVGLFAAECPGHANQTQRKLPWASTLQVSLTLALVNPVLWYLVDRSKPGFFLSAGVGVIGTTVLLSLNPEMMPSPLTSPSLSSQNGTSVLASQAFGDFLSQETIECGTWIISVLFCSCVCFGNIGRRLALKRGSTVRRDSLQ